MMILHQVQIFAFCNKSKHNFFLKSGSYYNHGCYHYKWYLVVPQCKYFKFFLFRFFLWGVKQKKVNGKCKPSSNWFHVKSKWVENFWIFNTVWASPSKYFPYFVYWSNIVYFLMSPRLPLQSYPWNWNQLVIRFTK